MTRFAIAAATLVALGVAGCNTSSSSDNNSGSSSGSSSGKANVYIVASKSSCLADPLDAYVFTTVVVHNSGTKDGSITPQVDYHYNDGGDTIDGPVDSTDVPAGATETIRFKHSYEATNHDLVDCTAMRDFDDNGVTIQTVTP